MNLRTLAINKAKAHNKFLKDEDFKNMSTIDILRVCHPIDRVELMKKAGYSIEEIEPLKQKYDK